MESIEMDKNEFLTWSVFKNVVLMVGDAEMAGDAEKTAIETNTLDTETNN